jgi:hypothetical protein
MPISRVYLPLFGIAHRIGTSHAPGVNLMRTIRLKEPLCSVGRGAGPQPVRLKHTVEIFIA